jgi:hypothetical protein
MGHIQLKIFVEFLALLVVSTVRVRSLLKKMKHQQQAHLQIGQTSKQHVLS